MKEKRNGRKDHLVPPGWWEGWRRGELVLPLGLGVMASPPSGQPPLSPPLYFGAAAAGRRHLAANTTLLLLDQLPEER